MQCGALHLICLAGPYFSLGHGCPTGALQDHPHTFVTSTPCLSCALPSYCGLAQKDICLGATVIEWQPQCVRITVSLFRLHV